MIQGRFDVVILQQQKDKIFKAYSRCREVRSRDFTLDLGASHLRGDPQMKVGRSQVKVVGVPMIGKNSMVGKFWGIRKYIAVFARVCLEKAIFAPFGITNLRHLKVKAATICASYGYRPLIQQRESIIGLLISRERPISEATESLVHETRKVFDCLFSGFSGHSVWRPCCQELKGRVQ